MPKWNGVVKCLGAILLLWPIWGQAELIRLTSPSNLLVTAQYHQGQSGYPAILLLHGFLQTRDTPPMSELGQSLADAGYTVLMPTLSLGYEGRSQSLDCAAVHKHTLNEDIAELDLWTKWLHTRLNLPVILIGHSNGGAIILNYIANHPDKNVQGAILTSLVPMKISRDEFRRAQHENKKNTLHEYSLSYCQHSYISTVAGYLSYASLDATKMLAKLRRSKVPVQIIIGGDDQVFMVGWGKKLVHYFPSTIVIPQASHFFADGAEFLLFDRVQDILRKWRSSPR